MSTSELESPMVREQPASGLTDDTIACLKGRWTPEDDESPEPCLYTCHVYDGDAWGGLTLCHWEPTGTRYVSASVQFGREAIDGLSIADLIAVKGVVDQLIATWHTELGSYAGQVSA